MSHNLLPTRFQVGTETLAGEQILEAGNSAPRVLFVHGAGSATKERLQPLAMELAHLGISSFAFDSSGYGDSTGSIQASSLEKRSREAAAALTHLQGPHPHAVCGSSMGGHIALSLLRVHQVETLLLIAPAIYATEAFAVPFGPGFSEIIRRNESWRRADVLEPLQSFRGNLLIYVGEDDAVIPSGVIDLLDKHSPNASTKRIVQVPGWGHRLPVWLAEDQAACMVLAQELRSLMSNQP